MPTRNLSHRSLSLLLFVWLAALRSYAQEDVPFTRLFDTGSSSPEPLPSEAIAQRAGWTLVPEDQVNHKFSGDTALLNDRLAVVLRKQGWGAEVYARTAGGLKHRATLGLGATHSSRVESRDALQILENGASAVLVEATFRNLGPRALRFRLTTGEAILEIRPGDGAERVVVQSKTRYVVVPDYFGDDVVFGSEVLRGAYLPAENFCLNLLEGGDAILMSVWQSSEQDVWLGTASRPKDGDLCASSIQCLKGKSIWLAFLESPRLWHASGASAQADWKPPFPAKWRCGLVRQNGVAESWITEKPERGVAARSADFSPPAPDTSTVKRPEGRVPNLPLLVYPIDRSAATPLTVTCPTDVMRNTLGVGPCQYILACEGLAAQGDPTPNAVMTWVEKQFEGKKATKAADDIQERLQTMTDHVAHARIRIERYAEFAGQVRKLIPDKPGADTFRPMVDDLDRLIATGLGPTASPERAKQLATEVSSLIGKDDALPACQRLGEQLRAIGAVQDGTLARCRMAVRRLRAQSKAVVSNQGSESGLAREVQSLAGQMLQKR